ncbi:hypothetical protein SAY87_013016 [Trapa incisa]|uniref:Uncharacterized protein n=1 Tax=Trapa incisa TaxID=236973 RepID=A0AAN7QCQ6_9MYRT|nr:hypothetical protein SAY87_013016 [Trapa incisa]
MAISCSTAFTSSSSFHLSAPTSPEKHLLNALLLYFHKPEVTGPTTSAADGDAAGADLHGFEFETSQRFFCYVHDEPPEVGGQAMAFADELFSCGTVVPLMKLKPPPIMLGTDKSSGSSRPSPRMMARGGPVSWRTLWSHDYDPFQVALMKVRKEDRRRGRGDVEGERRARSLSPLRRSHLGEPCDDGARMRASEPVERESGTVKILARPRGLEFARRVMMVRSRNAEPSINKKSGSKERQRMKKLLTKKTNPKREKIETSADHCKEKTGLLKMVKMAIPQYSPRLFLCSGHGIKAHRKVQKSRAERS